MRYDVIVIVNHNRPKYNQNRNHNYNRYQLKRFVTAVAIHIVVSTNNKDRQAVDYAYDSVVVKYEKGCHDIHKMKYM
jgi:hypothetical protein